MTRKILVSVAGDSSSFIASLSLGGLCCCKLRNGSKELPLCPLSPVLPHRQFLTPLLGAPPFCPARGLGGGLA